MFTKVGKWISTIVILAILAGFTIVFGQSALAAPAPAISLTGATYTQDFNTLATSGTTNSTLPTDWYLSESGTSSRVNGQYAADTGASNTGDTYSYGSSASSERAFGALLSGTISSIIGAQFVNNTGSTVTSLTVSYTGEQWRLGALARTDRIDFQYSLDATSLTTGAWTDVDSLDFTAPVTGPTTGALDGNSAANRTAISYTITGLSIANGATFWIRWTDYNASSSDDGLAVDDFSISTSGGPVTPNLSIDDVTQNEGDSGTTTFTFTVSLSAPAPAGGVTFDIAAADNTATTADNDYVANSLTGQTIAEGNSAYTFNVTVNGDTTVEGNETFYVNVTNVTGANVTDAQGQGTIANDDVTVTFIHDIQGSGSAVTGPGPFTVEAIVVGDYQTQGSGQLRGFFIQEEDADADADPATSEGIFVFCSSCPTAVNVGDKVRVTGTASEFNNMSELSATTAGSVVVQSTGNPLPTPGSITLPVPGVPTGDLAAATAYINAYYETFEGMLVTFPATLSVSEYFELARYGQIILSAGGRPQTFTVSNAPSASGYTDHQIDLASRTIILDDTDNRENRPIDVPNTAYYYPVPGLSTGNYFRGGDTIANLTGVLHWDFAGGSSANEWRIRPVVEAYSYAFTSFNPRPSVPTVNGRLKVASFNVLNYFVTIDTSNVCGPAQNQDCRGADSVQEFNYQRAKLLAALTAIDADVFGFMELENTPGVEPLADIVAGLPGYAYIDAGVIGSDTIRVGIIYKTSTVTPVGSFAVLDTAAFVDPLNTGSDRNRPALAQTFEEIATGERFTVVVNHLKSKGCSGATGLDADQNDGQSCWNATRAAAVQELLSWIAGDPTGAGDPDYLIIGDMNSYAMEDPIAAFESGGYANLVSLFGGSSAYSYVFDGQLGYLDHALANPSLLPQVAGLAEWHINADEIPLFDYNDDVKDTGESSFEEESDVTTLYSADAYRTSDHDPVIVGLNLDATPPVVTVPGDMTIEATGPTGATATFSASALDNVDGPLTPSCVPASGSLFPLGDTLVTCSATDAAGNTGSASFTISVVDTTAPTLNLPADITVYGLTPLGTIVTYTVTATDLVDANPTVACAPASGSLFPIGSTTVNCSAQDDYGNTSYGSFNVMVVEPVSNLLLNPGFDQFITAPKAWQYSVINIPASSLRDCAIFFLSPSCSLKLAAARTTSIVTQTVSYNGLAGNMFSFGLFSKALNVPAGGTYRVEVALFNRLNRVMLTQTVNFNNGTHDFEAASNTFTAPAAFNKIRFRFYFQKSAGVAWFDDAFLYRLP
ncbi:MAG: ExeM/NucH family extracellular endonuclease [Chloroflexota bacterium]